MLLLFIIFILKLLSSPAFLFSWSNTLFILSYFSLSGCLASLNRLFSLLPQRGLGFVIEGPQWEQSPRNRKARSVYPLGGQCSRQAASPAETQEEASGLLTSPSLRDSEFPCFFPFSFPPEVHGSLPSQALSYTCHSYLHPQALAQPLLLSNLFSLRNMTWASSPTGRPHAQVSLVLNYSLDQGVIWLKRGRQRLESGTEK